MARVLRPFRLIDRIEARQLFSAAYTLTEIISSTKGVTNSTSAAINGPATVTLYAATGSTVDSNSVALTTLKKAVNLKAGASKPISLKLRKLPPNFVAGAYTLFVQTTDPTGTVTTSAAGPALTVAAAVVTPAVSISAISPAAAAGKAGSVTLVISNTGNVTSSGAATIDIGYTTTGSSEAASFYSKPRSLKIAPGTSETLVIHFKFPATLAAGTYTPFATVALNGVTASASSTASWTIASA